MVDVILCSRNGEKYIREQIESILAQTCQEFVLHIYDDCSVDHTEEIVNLYVQQFPGKVFFEKRSRPTGSACRNFLRAVAEAGDADFYMLSDQDDIWHPDKMEKMLTVMKKNDQRIPMLIQCDSRVVDTRGKEIAPSFEAYSGINGQRDSFAAELIENNVTGGAVLFNRTLKELIQTVSENASMHDHWLGLVVKAFGKYVYMPEALYDYRQHESNVLGAEKGGFLKKLKNRLGIGGKRKEEVDRAVHRNLEKDILQAGEFRQIFGDRLSEKQKNDIEALECFTGEGRFRRLGLVLKHGFTYSKWYQTIGELVLTK